ncbi:LysR substrate-binding domain-containing protein [Pelomonas sp. KK5]|uniref:LysR substrate-binding domain-containing protein n=1 Tax=Pelomonas sp. KK5 TaxID=1855730 RepID=UPI00097C6DEB|nr:LysR substrate-binding domain-containing protein [Pelomonas sp. KK5]
MELRQLRYFLGVCEAGSLLKASARLHVAQPALGQQMSALEAELGTQLLLRSRKGVSPTEAGRTFAEHARLVLADVERAAQAVREAGALPSGSVTIGLPTTVALGATLPILAACRERLPQVRLQIVEAYSGFLAEWLQSGRLDVAILFGDKAENGLDKRALLDEELVFVTGSSMPALPKRLSLARLARWPLVLPSRGHGLRRIIDEACEPLGLQLDVVAEIDSLPSVKKAAEAGIGGTILSRVSVAEEIAGGRLQAARIASDRMSRRVVCATHLTRPATPASRAVAALIPEVIQGMVGSKAWPGRWVGGT